MRTIFFLLLVLMATCSRVSAADRTLADYRSIFDDQVAKIGGAHDAGLALLLDQYERHLCRPQRER